MEPKTCKRSDVLIFGRGRWPDVMQWSRQEPGWVVFTLPSFWAKACELRRLGWRACYDCLDDWSAFVRSGDLSPDAAAAEPQAFAESDLVTASAASLARKAKQHGRDALLVRNGGPERLVALEEHGGGQGRVRLSAVYVGYLMGSWLDWSAFSVLGKSGVRTTVIGKYLEAPQLEGVEFVGEMPQPEALELMARCEVGIIPFRGAELCAAVDPIKAYDYWASGLWVLATPELAELADRPYRVIAPVSDWPEAAAECSRRRAEDPPSASFVASNAWSRRARQFLSALEPRRAWRVEGKRPVPPTRAAHRFRVTWQAPAACSASPACPYCNTRDERSRRPSSLPGDRSSWVKGFLGLADRVGRPLLSICYGEPMDDPAVVAIAEELSGFMPIDLVTNLLAPLHRFERLSATGNVALATSFHPHQWPSLEAFLNKRAAVERTGVRCGTVLIVAWPPLLTAIPDWTGKLAERGIPFQVLEFWGSHDGRDYPAAYTEEERRMLWGERAAQEAKAMANSAGVACRAGMDYLWVSLDGEVFRCYMPGPRLGSIFDPAGVDILRAPEPCPSGLCPCPDMWQFQVRNTAQEGPNADGQLG